MKKLLLCSALTVICAASIFAAPKPKYISPNNDGVQDNLEIPLQISDARYIQGWSLVVLDSNKKVVRTIENKVALPERVGFKSFFKQLVTPKKGVIVPEVVVWNGAMNNGETAPDGLYYYYITATDDNGNTGKTNERQVIVDTLAPEITLNQPGDKIFGEGSKSSFKIKQSGSDEDYWTGTFKAADGKTVKTFKWENTSPNDFYWNGTDDADAQVPDGIYSYEITSTDRAGNKSSLATISNIIYSADKPSTNIFVEGSKYFSPKTESSLKNVVLNLAIQIPEAKTGNKLVEWQVAIKDKSGKIVRTYNNDKNGLNPPKSITFDGIDDGGNLLPDGEYQASVTAKYINGYEPAELFSPVLVLDRERPIVQIEPSDKIFGAGSKGSVDFAIMVAPDSGAPIKSWKGTIKNSLTSSVVKNYDFGEYLPEEITWNGLSDKGGISPKGQYVLEIYGEDLAGNIGGGSSSDLVTFDTTETQLLLDMSYTAFSPNGDNVKDIIRFTPVTATKNVVSYNFEIKDEKGKVVYSVKEKGKLPKYFEWSGKANDKILCNDGKYSAALSVVAPNGSEASAGTQAFEIDTVAPYLEVSSPWLYFATTGNGTQKNIPLEFKSVTPEKLWKCDIADARGNIISTLSWSGKKDKLTWDGTDKSGNIAPDGIYNIVISSTDDGGNRFETAINGITLDNRETKTYITAEYNGISPNEDAVLDTQVFNIKTSVAENIQSWKFNVRKEDGSSVYSLTEKDMESLPEIINWDGKDKNGNTCEGTFTGTLDIVYKTSNYVSGVSMPFICTATPPNLVVKTTPEYFSPDNDGVDDDLFIELTGSTKSNIKNWSFVIKDPKGNDFWKTAGKSQITEKITWDGLSNIQKDRNGNAERVQSAMDYPFIFTVSDDLGMTSVAEGFIPVDVLVIRNGDILKMAVPSIIFESDSDNFQNPSAKLTKAQVAKNLQILDRIADILKKFEDYRVTIVGHANKITDNPQEELVDNLKEWGRGLMPLSKERADAIKEYLIKKGVKASALSTDGMGGTQPVANPKDKDNNWKNRRVEFILQK